MEIKSVFSPPAPIILPQINNSIMLVHRIQWSSKAYNTCFQLAAFWFVRRYGLLPVHQSGALLPPVWSDENGGQTNWYPPPLPVCSGNEGNNPADTEDPVSTWQAPGTWKAFEHQVWIRKLFKAQGSGKEIPCIQLTMPSHEEIGIKHILRLDTKGIFFLLLIQQAGRIDHGFQQPEFIHQVLLTSSLPNRGDTMLLNRGWPSSEYTLLFRKRGTRVKGRDWYDLEWYVRKSVAFDLHYFFPRAQDTGDWNENTITKDQIIKIKTTQKSTSHHNYP